MKKNTSLAIISVYCALCFMLLLSFYSGLSTSGPDYHNYLAIIGRVSNEVGFFNKILVSKDIFLGVVIYFIDPNGLEQYYLIFLSICFISSISKLFLIPYMGRWFFFFVICYWVLLAPGLEFTAIRSLLGLSFLLIYLILKDKFFISKILMIFSILSHKSMLIPLIFQLDLVVYLHRKLGFIFYGILVAIPTFIFSMFLHTYYSDILFLGRLSGMRTVFLNGLYVLSPISLILFYKNSNVDFLNNKMLGLAYSLSVFGLFAFPTNIIADRVLEMSSFFMLIALFTIDFKNMKINVLSILFVYFSFAFLFISALKRNTALGLWQVFGL